MRPWLRDLLFACRTLARARGLTLVATLTLALGIGMNTAIFSGVHAYLWTPLPYPEPERLVALAQSNPAQGTYQASISWLDARDWRAAAALEPMALYRDSAAALSGAGEPAVASVIEATPRVFDVLRVKPAHGRLFGDRERRVAVLADGLWRRQFAGGLAVLGREIRLDARNFTVIGILPPRFTFLYEDVDLFVPLDLPPEALANRANRGLDAIARLGPGAGIAQARAQIQAISARMAREAAETNQGWTGQVLPLHEAVIPRNGAVAAKITLSAVAFVLLIACANVANLLLARGVLRRRELAIRASLGASRIALARLLLAESAVLALAGGALGILVAHWGMVFLKTLAPPDLAHEEWTRVNWTALAYTLGLAVFAALAAGIAPAWLLSRRDAAPALQEASRTSAGGRRRVFKAFVVIEVAAAVVLLAAAGLLIRSLEFRITASPGFDQRNLLVARVSLPEARYAAPAQAAAFFDQVLERLRADPRVRAAAAADSVPIWTARHTVSLVVEGRAAERDVAARFTVTPAHFRTFGIPLLAGRDFDSSDTLDRATAVIVNQTMAERYWAGAASALGRRFQVGSNPRWFTVIGVARDVRNAGIDRPAWPAFYRAHAQFPALAMTLAVRTSVEPAKLAGTLRAAVAGVDRDLPVYGLESLEEMLNRMLAGVRAMTKILGMLAGLALLLASIGIYGSIAYMVGRRTREIGVRLALGATPAGVFRAVLGSGLALMSAGVAAGLPCAFALMPVLRGFLAGVESYDPLTFAGLSAILFAVAVVACLVPARRAMRLDPVAALRLE